MAAACQAAARPERIAELIVQQLKGRQAQAA
jgi:hypothetical protein